MVVYFKGIYPANADVHAVGECNVLVVYIRIILTENRGRTRSVYNKIILSNNRWHTRSV